VGGSFMHAPAEQLQRASCLSNVRLFFYLRNAVFGGLPYRELEGPLDPAKAGALRHPKVALLEENESHIARYGYVPLLRQVLLGD
jgi:hypothetical protein